MVGKALYTINKEAKRMRDLKYAAAEFYEQNYTDNEDLKIYLEQRGFEFDENGRKVVYDQYGRASRQPAHRERGCRLMDNFIKKLARYLALFFKKLSTGPQAQGKQF